ncbi:spermatogenesis-associated protein 22 [Oryzias melastigma]|uniref:Spermatogenesis associated 22 n=1 Tax=Oryzias melastigma TaxID=30732 RepID=A0A3B3DAS1_ORYME|nr:spermatogenesis-associated protein 22 [Oryzias melastigma]
MRRQENQPPRPTAGYLPVPLFNQRKRNRIPLTSVPCENEFYSHSEYPVRSSSSAPQGSPAFAAQSHQWNKPSTPQSALAQPYGSSRPAPGPSSSFRGYVPVPHPYRAGTTSTNQPGDAFRKHDSISSSYSGQRMNVQSRMKANTGPSQLSSPESAKPSPQFSQQSRPAPPSAPRQPYGHAAQPPNNSWRFTNSFESQTSPVVEQKRSSQPQSGGQAKPQPETSPVKPAVENSLRILTAVIRGMRHWSQFKDKVPYLFEIFATLDSAVTLGRYGAKNFLMRDGKEVLQCVYYETEQVLPRLIRGQVHRCVGNYDRSRDVLMCVSVRAGLPSELRNAQEAVKACDAEMRALVKTLSEV